MKSINEIAIMVWSNAKKKGFHPDNETEDHFIEKACNNLHDEIYELHEARRNHQLDELCDKSEAMIAAVIKPLTCKEEELADIAIRVLDNMIELNCDPYDIIMRKHQYNTTRKKLHGGKKS